MSAHCLSLLCNAKQPSLVDMGYFVSLIQVAPTTVRSQACPTAKSCHWDSVHSKVHISSVSPKMI